MIDNKKILVVVTARAGSKRIIGKNFRNLLGKPLFMWSMIAAEQSKYVDGVILSTNCKECQKICNEYLETRKRKNENLFGWIARPDDLAGDLSKNEDALIHALDYFKAEKFNVVVNLQPTSPCRLGGLIDRCIETYDEGEYDSLLTASKDTPFIWQRIEGEWKYSVDKNDCCDRKMKQEFQESEMLYHDDGNIYITDKNILLDKKCRIGYNPYIFEIDGINKLQIDEEFDFQLIENMAKTLELESLV